MTEEKNTKGYIYGLGRRKQSIAKVKVFFSGSGKITINGKSLDEYIKVYEKIEMVKAPLRETGMTDTFDIEVAVCGGGIAGQAGAISLGIARALIKFDENLRPVLKKLGFLERDARVKERKKFGLKKARRAPQWSKR